MLFGIVACDHADFPSAVSSLVVEGYIDAGGFPVVMLTTSVPVSSSVQYLDSLQEHLIRWARVAVSDGENEVVLTGKFDRNYFPPYIYTTGGLRGEVGKTYTLTVDYDRYHATAVTTIPSVPQIDSIRVLPTSVDSLCSIKIAFTDSQHEKNYYKVFVRKGVYARQWRSSYLGVLDDGLLDGCSELTVSNGELLTDTLEYTPFFQYTDTIGVKFAAIDREAYLYWKSYEEYTNFSRNPLFPVNNNLFSNIQGGIGCWYGCGANIFYLNLNEYRSRQP